MAPDGIFMMVAGLSLALPAVAYNTSGFSWGLQLCISAIYVLVFALFVAASRLTQQFNTVVAATAAFLAIALPMIVFAKITDYGPPRRYDALTRPPYLEKLVELQQNGLYRHFALDAAPMPNTQTGFGLPGLSWIVPTVPNVFREFFQRFMDRGLHIPNWYAANVGVVPNMSAIDELYRNLRFFSLAGVKYVTTQRPVERDEPGRLHKTFSDEATGTSILENPSANLRLFLATNIKNVEDQAQAWDSLARLVNLSDTAVVERDLPSSTDCAEKKLDVEEFTVYPNSVKAVVAAHCSGMLVLSDLYFPGWHASLDGTEQSLYRVDGVFRGVSIERAGRYVVEFWYRPLSWNMSLTLFSLGASILLIFPLFRLYAQRATFRARR